MTAPSVRGLQRGREIVTNIRAPPKLLRKRVRRTKPRARGAPYLPAAAVLIILMTSSRSSVGSWRPARAHTFALRRRRGSGAAAAHVEARELPFGGVYVYVEDSSRLHAVLRFDGRALERARVVAFAVEGPLPAEPRAVVEVVFLEGRGPRAGEQEAAAVFYYRYVARHALRKAGDVEPIWQTKAPSREASILFWHAARSSRPDKTSSRGVIAQPS